MCANGHRGPPSDHFDGRRFFNHEPIPHKSDWDIVRWRVARRDPGWPRWVQSEPGPTPPERVPEAGLRYTVVNHATVLIQTGGVNVLTDPIWSKRTSPVEFAGPRRVRAPGLEMDQIPPLDAVLISHNHFDHMDAATLRKLCQRGRPLILTGVGNARYLKNVGADRVEELDWWQSRQVDGVDIHYVPARHWSRRGFGDTNLALWGGFVVEAPFGRVHFVGDTGYGSFFKDIRERLGPVDLAFLPIGSFKPRWFMRGRHMNPTEAVQAHVDLQSQLSVAIHFGTFANLADDGFGEPELELKSALEAGNVSPGDFEVPVFGAGRQLERGAES